MASDCGEVIPKIKRTFTQTTVITTNTQTTSIPEQLISSAPVQFGDGSSILSAGEKGKLDKIAQTLIQGQEIVITGNAYMDQNQTNSDPINGVSNTTYSQLKNNRANAVVDYLTTKYPDIVIRSQISQGWTRERTSSIQIVIPASITSNSAATSDSKTTHKDVIIGEW